MAMSSMWMLLGSILVKATGFFGRHVATCEQKLGLNPILRIGGALVITAVAAMACDKLGLSNPNPATPTPSGPPAPATAIVYSAIGASDAIGHGSSQECLPVVDCPGGKGYVQVAIAQLKAKGFSVSQITLAVPAGVISRTFQTLGQQYGRTIPGNLIELAAPNVFTSSTLVTIFTGANEVNTITAALGGGAGGANPAGYIDRQVSQFGADYATLVTAVRARAASAQIIVLNVPNLAGLPFLANVSLQQRQAAQRASVGMTTTSVNRLQNVRVIDLMCDARSYLATNYSSDGLHPNDAGYAFIANEVVLAATSSVYPAPGGSCPQMTAVPNP
jgi:lysophospholipase L1-like esterase